MMKILSKRISPDSFTTAKLQKKPMQTKTLLVSILFLVCFFIITLIRPSFQGIDQDVSLWSASINSGFFTMPAKTISAVFDTTSMIVLSVVVAVFLLLFHHAQYSLFLLGSMGGTALLVDLCKSVIQSPRPLNQIVSEPGFSFPSGHTTSTVVFFGVLAYFVWKHSKTIKAKGATLAAYVSIASIVGFDRIYLNVHWFTDVIGAIFLGGFWLAFCVFVFTNVVSSRRLSGF